ncbi:DUF2130 domain-containing protein [Reichenbachiella sp.]|uniref:DUF2130 domain-containing protein n=1 Tax=Reichenbachiella sp. TaxID=2184521 RepID=UPI003B5C1C04
MKIEKTKLEKEFIEKENAMVERQQELKKKEASVDEIVQQKLESEKLVLEKKAVVKAKKDVDIELLQLKSELEEKQLNLNKSKQIEIENERLKREAKEKEADIRLQVEKEMQNRAVELEKQIIAREGQRQDMKLAEKEKQLSDLRKQLDEARRKAEQGSMQTQGEVQELALEEELQSVFRFDSIQEVPKGTSGADTLQTVRTQYGKECGMIAFESKNAKRFDEKWVLKLKNDMRTHGAKHGIIVTGTMPKDMPVFGLRDGVWVCTFKEVIGLTAAIRQVCITETTIKASEENKEGKVHALYNYLMSHEFKQRVEGIIQGASNMKTNVEKERKSMLAFWKKQEVQIDQMNFMMLDVIGSIDGLSGNALGPINGLELGDGSEAA